MEFPGIIDIKTIGLVATTGVIPLVLALFIRWKTGSFLTVWTRLWSLFHGKKSPTATFIKEYLDSQISVMQLIFSTGAKLRTEQHAKRAIDWHKVSDESLEDAARCGRYFDWEAMQLDPAIPRKPGPSIALIASLATTAAFLLAITVHDKLLVRMNETGTWFNVTNHYAQPIFSEKRLIFKKCTEDLAAVTKEGGFSARNTKLICDIFRKAEQSEIDEYVKRSYREQQIIAGFYAILCLLLMYIPTSALMQQTSANNMEKRFRARAGSV